MIESSRPTINSRGFKQYHPSAGFSSGVTIREHMAIEFMKGYIISGVHPTSLNAEAAVKAADDLIKQLEK